MRGCKKNLEVTSQDELIDTELLYTWQYDYRCVAAKLRKGSIRKSAKESPTEIWNNKTVYREINYE